jgi:arginine decarboxylase
MPEFVAKHPRYERVGLRDLCDQIHEHLQAQRHRPPDDRDVPVGHGTGDEAGRRLRAMAHREIDRVPIDDLEGRVTSVLLTPYPPGIPLLIPGERFNRDDRPLPAVRARLQRALPRLRDRHPRPRGVKG